MKEKNHRISKLCSSYVRNDRFLLSKYKKKSNFILKFNCNICINFTLEIKKNTNFLVNKYIFTYSLSSFIYRDLVFIKIPNFILRQRVWNIKWVDCWCCRKWFSRGRSNTNTDRIFFFVFRKWELCFTTENEVGSKSGQPGKWLAMITCYHSISKGCAL